MSNGKTWLIGVPAALVALTVLGGASIPIAREVFAPGSDSPPYASIARLEQMVGHLVKKIDDRGKESEAATVRGNLLGAWRACRQALAEKKANVANDSGAQISLLQEEYLRLTGDYLKLSDCP